MRLLVIGKSGQLAQSLQSLPEQNDCEIISIGRPQLDITNPTHIESTIQKIKPSIIINAAAYTNVDLAEEFAAQAFEVNETGPYNLAQVCKGENIPLIHISTDYVFDGKKASAYEESDPPSPLCIYGASKLAGENIIAKTLRQHLIFRTSWVFSPFGKNFPTTMLSLAQTGEEITVVADQFGCPTYAPHLASSLVNIARHAIKAASTGDDIWGTYHLCGNGQTNWYEFAREIFKRVDIQQGPTCKVLPTTSATFKAKANRPQNSTMNCRKAKQVFGEILPLWQDAIDEWLAHSNIQSRIQINGGAS